MQHNFTLLIDGKEAFPAILSAIGQAKHSVYINMFLWRDDNIGQQMAQAVLSAAERGVKVYLSLDRYAFLLECSEEWRRSFFHRKPSFVEWVKICTLLLLYPGSKKSDKARSDALRQAIIEHPHITLDCERFKADHSKYYIIDDEILILGGINIEDKENGQDLQGRVYQDYMAVLCGNEYVTALKNKLNGEDSSLFAINSKALHRFDMEQHYLDLINSAEKELFITMSYFSPLKNIINALLKAHQRGVKITLLLPEKSNFQNDSNYKTARQLLKKSSNGIKVLLSPKMLHTKLFASERQISFGSCNVTKKAFRQLDELNLSLQRDESLFCCRLMDSVMHEQNLARRVTWQELHYHRILAFLEGFLV